MLVRKIIVFYCETQQWLEYIGDVGVDSMIVTLSRALVISVALFDEAAPDRPYAYAYARWFHA